MNYEKAKIYKVLNNKNDKCFIGSTVSSLSSRMAQLRRLANTTYDNLSLEMRKVGIDSFYIELIELYPCKIKEQLTAREQELSRALKIPVNITEHRAFNKRAYKHKPKQPKTPRPESDTDDIDEELESLDLSILNEYVPECLVQATDARIEYIKVLRKHIDSYQTDKFILQDLENECNTLQKAVDLMQEYVRSKTTHEDDTEDAHILLCYLSDFAEFTEND
jgi:hypothetical protein